MDPWVPCLLAVLMHMKNVYHPCSGWAQAPFLPHQSQGSGCSVALSTLLVADPPALAHMVLAKL